MKYAKACINNDNSRIYAKSLVKNAKVFTKWNYEKYMMGNIGDYICYTIDNEHDIYIINKKVFEKTYKSIF